MHRNDEPIGDCSDQHRSCEESAAMTSRRRFLQQASTITMGSVTLTLLSGCDGHQQGNHQNSESAEQAPLYGFLVDVEKCIGAGKCLTACRQENDVPDGCHRTWVERYVHFKDGRVEVTVVPETGYTDSDLPVIDQDLVDRSYFVPKLCNHCDDAPCNQVCPTQSSFTSPEGVELVDPELCIGCAYCVQACPYGVRFINPETGNADKCTWCYHRIVQDEQPACVEACPVAARVFGRLDDPASEICKRIAEIPTSVLKKHLGTHPKLRYVGLSTEVT